jgi:hypothetical protein
MMPQALPFIPSNASTSGSTSHKIQHLTDLMRVRRDLRCPLYWPTAVPENMKWTLTFQERRWFLDHLNQLLKKDYTAWGQLSSAVPYKITEQGTNAMTYWICRRRWGDAFAQPASLIYRCCMRVTAGSTGSSSSSSSCLAFLNTGYKPPSDPTPKLEKHSRSTNGTLNSYRQAYLMLTELILSLK